MSPLQLEVERLVLALAPAAQRVGLLALVLNGELVIRGPGQARVWQAGPASPGWRLIWQARPGDTPAVFSVRSWEHARDTIAAELESRRLKTKATPSPERLADVADRAERCDDMAPRETGCKCHIEVGDSPCPVHGDEE